MSKAKVAIVDNSMDITGALRAILAYAQFARNEFSFLFILPVHSKAKAVIASAGFEVVEVSFIEIGRSWKSLIFYFPQLLLNGFKLKKLIQNHQVQLVHVNDFYNMAPIVAILLGGKFKLITHVRFMPDRFPSILMKVWVYLNLQYADTVVCVSEAVKSLLPNHPKVRLIYDTLSQMRPHSLKDIKGNEHVRLLYLGHYIPGKGQDYAVDAFAMALQENPSLRLKFVGGDMGLQKNQLFKLKLIQRAKKLGVQGQVAFFGPAIQIQGEVMEADIMLNFSESESFSITCLEALSIGTPLIATDCGGPAELFIHKESGWLVPNRNKNAMKHAILQLAEDMELRKKLSANSSIFVSEKFAKSKTSGRLKDLYISVLNCHE